MGTKHSHVVLDLETGSVLPHIIALPADSPASIVWRELILHIDQLLNGAAGGVLQAELLSIIGNPAVGNTLRITNGALVETFTFRAAWAAPFDVVIGVGVDATMLNLVNEINAQSTLWKAAITTSLDKWFAASPTTQVVVMRRATTAAADRMYGTLTVPGNIRVVAFSDSYGYEESHGVESNLPAVDPAAKRFGFGRAYADLQTNETHVVADSIEAWTWDSDDELWVLIGKRPAVPVSNNKDMTCAVTIADGDQATASTVALTPTLDGYIQVMVNGKQVSVGDGVKTKDCYFSGDAGVTARAIANIVAGDTCHWVGSVAGYQLGAADRMDWNYTV
jgi:hypothetical protein